MSFVAGFTAGLMAGKKKFGGSGSGDGELWTPPADWLEVPEPGAWGANFLIELNENNLNFEISFGDPKCCWTGAGTISIDWGDSNITSASGPEIIDKGGGSFEYDASSTFSTSIFKHTYEAAGQYVIKVTTDKFNCLLQYTSDKANNIPALLIAKLGTNICLETNGSSSNKNYYGGFQGCIKLRWAMIKGNIELPHYCFNGCNYLKRLDFTNKISEVPYVCFNNCCALNFKNIDFSKVTKIGDSSFYNCYNLQKISAPLCTSVGNSAFSSCFALGNVEFAGNCTFGTNAFQNCYIDVPPS